jgi:5-hydroxyisourate hydrolase
MSKITTHILDTSKGKPAEGVRVILYHGTNDQWEELARAATNKDGRVPELAGAEHSEREGIFKLRFETRDYFDKERIDTFYPYVEIIFEVSRAEHYHVPLLLNPFGYSTYRGS